MEPFLIGVAGGTASGKTSVCHRIEKDLGCDGCNRSVAIISLDSFYLALNPQQIAQANAGKHNFDHPDAFDFDLLETVLTDLRAGKSVKVPHYDFKTHSRHPTNFTTVSGSDIIVIEGILIFFHKRITDLFHMKIFVDTDADTRLARRVKRDIAERGRDVESVLSQYEKFVKTSFDEFVFPSRRVADVIVPWNENNPVAVDLIAQHIRHQLEKRVVARRRLSQSGELPVYNELAAPAAPGQATQVTWSSQHFFSIACAAGLAGALGYFLACKKN
eukprot:TRINITY_DN2416_c0_g1_i1.p1 TRINITY_DN2416_c0_g1~~TRINITY_DN2416_c0_g1_i1.p1  ORF type:complete len:286 (+),score=5.82 TRINITY_DN2416_c0_g1_i1:39-860(+)